MDEQYFKLAQTAIPQLAKLYPSFREESVAIPSLSYQRESAEQMKLFVCEKKARYGR